MVKLMMGVYAEGKIGRVDISFFAWIYRNN
jgi:hypothetical protein